MITFQLVTWIHLRSNTGNLFSCWLMQRVNLIIWGALKTPQQFKNINELKKQLLFTCPHLININFTYLLPRGTNKEPSRVNFRYICYLNFLTKPIYLWLEAFFFFLFVLCCYLVFLCGKGRKITRAQVGYYAVMCL